MDQVLGCHKNVASNITGVNQSAPNKGTLSKPPLNIMLLTSFNVSLPDVHFTPLSTPFLHSLT